VNLIGHAVDVFGIREDIRMAARALQVMPMAATAGRSCIWRDRQPRSGGAGWVSGAVFLCQREPEPPGPQLVLTYYFEAGSGHGL
jgi:hypothetical protein